MIRILKELKYSREENVDKYYKEIAITEESDLDNIDTTSLVTGSQVQFLNTTTNSLKVYYFTEKDNDFHEI